jgi:D-arabinose 1-dehydrogenase-like Zn-dependent alcohol dehydrogenase
VKGVIAFSRKMIEDTVKLVEDHNLHPNVTTFEWRDARKAFEAFRDQKVVGKVVIKV